VQTAKHKNHIFPLGQTESGSMKLSYTSQKRDEEEGRRQKS